MEFSPRTRRALSTVLAVFLAVESVSVVAAAAALPRTATHQLPADPPAGRVLAVGAAALPAAPVVATASSAPASAPRVMEPAGIPVAIRVAAPAAVREAVPERAVKSERATKTEKATKVDKAAKVEKATKPTRSTRAHKSPTAKTTRSSGKPAARAYSGTNHVWIPSLGITRSVRLFPCDRSRAPDNYMYRWGCAGANNVYLMGHASSIMKPLHDAYVRGRLNVGMRAYYADGRGRVHAYAVKWWKLTRPTTAASWAWAAQSVPSMTLQTCVGARSEYRLMVRLVVVDE